MEAAGTQEGRSFADQLPVICWTADAEGRLTWLNRRGLDYGADDGFRPVAEAIRAARGTPFSRTIDLPGIGGTLRPFTVSAKPVRGEGEALSHWIGTCCEIHEDRRVTRSQAFLLRLGDRIREESDPEAILAIVSEAVGRELGADRVVYATIDMDEGVMHVGRDWRAAGPPLEAHDFPMSAYPEDYVTAHSRGQPLASDDLADDPGVSGPMRERFLAAGVHAFLSVPLVKRGRLCAVMAAQQFMPRQWRETELRLLTDVADRTWATLERADADAALRKSEEMFRTVTEAHPIPVVIADENGIVLGNPAFFEMMGVEQGALGAIDPRGWTAGGYGWEKFIEIVRANPRIDNYETNMVRHGVRFPVAVSWRHIVYRGEPAVISSIVDLTERKRAEEELARSREALLQAEKLTALGSLLAGVSHELNNPLSIVTAQSALLEEMAEGSPLAARAEKVRRAAERCSKIVQTFLAMARQKEPERRNVDPAEVVRAALDLTEYPLRTAGIEVRLEIGPDLPALHADPDQLHQVLVNLIVNAQQALEEQKAPRRLIVRVRRFDGGRLGIEVQDNGPGVPEEIRRRIFEPFFTTKPQGTGTGVGLSFSLGLIEAHGGRLELIEGDGGGACFRITLDAAPPTPQIVAMPAQPPVPSASRGTALIVDDEPDVAEVLALIAERAGYRVDIAADGLVAQALIGKCDYDIIVSDLRMPKLDGPALYDWLAREKPHLLARIGFVTGDTLGEAAARFVARCDRPVIEKPFTGESVRQLLAALAQPEEPVVQKIKAGPAA
ncbi:response regulator [Sphingomonas parva]|uniref:histidine kinase n=1 Tax=Sphingomonas parva TaxID=2555898 RepID=A0A4Y8ZQ04_9SPHN|nr:ATP-binding protein [Sphingomonas parva]TFI58091.1 response regulator [Sphingomonas parva]